MEERRDVYTRSWWGKMWERNHFENQSGNGMVIIRSILRRLDLKACTGPSCLRIWTVGEYL
jgi:hypothetical protein